MTISTTPAALTAFILVLVRTSAWLVIVPPFGSRVIPTQVKIGLAVALSLPVFPKMIDQAPDTLDVAPFVGAVALQVVIGLALGFLTYLLFAAVQAAGELVDLFGGFTVAPAYDPLGNSQSSTFGRFYQLLVVTLLFVTNGHLLLVNGFMRSFDAIGFQGRPLRDLSELFVGELSTFFVAAIEIAAPLLAALFLAEVALGILSRAAPQMNVFMLGFPAKILLTLVLTGLTLPLIPGTISSIGSRAADGMSAVVRGMTQ